MNKKMDRLEESIQALSMRSNPHPRSNSTSRQSPPPTQSTARRGTRLSAQNSHVPPHDNPAQHRQSLSSAYGGGGAQSRIAPAIDTTQWRGKFYSGPTPPDDGQGCPPAGICVAQVVRRWNLKLTGERGENIEIFLDRVEECWTLARLTETEILKALPELFEGVAATWIRSNRQYWNTWAGFCNVIRRWCGINGRAQQRLAQEVTSIRLAREYTLPSFYCSHF